MHSLCNVFASLAGAAAKTLRGVVADSLPPRKCRVWCIALGFRFGEVQLMPRATAISARFANRGMGACLGALCLFALLSTEARAALIITSCTADPAACLAPGVPGINNSLNDVPTGGSYVDLPGVLSLDRARISGVFSPDQSMASLDYERFSPDPPTPAAPLSLVGQGANRNIIVADGDLLGGALLGLNFAGGLLSGVNTPGALAILYDIDQAFLGLDFVFFNNSDGGGGSSFIAAYAYARDGSLIGSGQIPGLSANALALQAYLFSGDRPIAGMLFSTNDVGGIAVTNLRYTPAPAALTLLLLGLPILAACRKRRVVEVS